LISIALLGHSISAPLAHAHVVAPAGAGDGEHGGAVSAAAAGCRGLGHLAAAVNDVHITAQLGGGAVAVDGIGPVQAAECTISVHRVAPSPAGRAAAGGAGHGVMDGPQPQEGAAVVPDLAPTLAGGVGEGDLNGITGGAGL